MSQQQRSSAVDAPDGAAVVVIGGGAVGTATAFALTRLGITDMVLVERDAIASGSTGRATGGVRLQWADELNVRMMLHSIAVFERWEEVVGPGVEYLPEITFHQNGYLILLDDEQDVGRFGEAIAMQQSFGVPSVLLRDRDEIARRAPRVDLSGVLAAGWCPRDGYLTPDAVALGFAAAAAARGATVLTRCEATGIEVVGDAVRAVQTTRGRIETGVVVCAAGIWSPAIGAAAGVDIPVHGEEHRNWFSPENGGLPDDLAMVIDFTTGLHVRREGPGLMFGSRAADLEAFADDVARRLPLIAELPISAEVTGFYDTSPDANAIIGELATPSRFLLATGFSGHGLMQSPAIGEHLAELIAGVEPTLDFGPLALGRFARGELRREAFKI